MLYYFCTWKTLTQRAKVNMHLLWSCSACCRCCSCCCWCSAWAALSNDSIWLVAMSSPLASCNCWSCCSKFSSSGLGGANAWDFGSGGGLLHGFLTCSFISSKDVNTDLHITQLRGFSFFCRFLPNPPLSAVCNESEHWFKRSLQINKLTSKHYVNSIIWFLKYEHL